VGRRGRRVLRLAAPLLAAAVVAGATAGARTPEQRKMAAVVNEWSALLNTGDNAGLARLYAVPALIFQSPYEYRLTSRAQIARWYALLPCSGQVVSITFHGRYATAVFRLGNRGRTKCDGPGTLAAARFEIVNGKIRSWAQVAVPQRGPIA
jgi:hypothetical protein